MTQLANSKPTSKECSPRPDPGPTVRGSFSDTFAYCQETALALLGQKTPLATKRNLVNQGILWQLSYDFFFSYQASHTLQPSQTQDHTPNQPASQIASSHTFRAGTSTALTIKVNIDSILNSHCLFVHIPHLTCILYTLKQLKN